MILLRVERDVNVYRNEDDELIEEIDVDEIPFDKLLTIVPPKEDDPLLYYGYVLDLMQLEQLNALLSKKIDVNLDNFSYMLVCEGIYDWNK